MLVLFLLPICTLIFRWPTCLQRNYCCSVLIFAVQAWCLRSPLSSLTKRLNTTVFPNLGCKWELILGFVIQFFYIFSIEREETITFELFLQTFSYFLTFPPEFCTMYWTWELSICMVLLYIWGICYSVNEKL